MLPLHLEKRSFELLQNEVKYRISLVSKSLPIKLRKICKCLNFSKKENLICLLTCQLMCLSIPDLFTQRFTDLQQLS